MSDFRNENKKPRNIFEKNFSQVITFKQKYVFRDYGQEQNKTNKIPQRKNILTSN